MRWTLALQEYRFTIVHRAGILNPANVPSREPLLCAANSTGSRLDEHALLWPLPTVLHNDFTPDLTPYTHEGLTQDLGISVGVTKFLSYCSPFLQQLCCLTTTVSLHVRPRSYPVQC